MLFSAPIPSSVQPDVFELESVKRRLQTRMRTMMTGMTNTINQRRPGPKCPLRMLQFDYQKRKPGRCVIPCIMLITKHYIPPG